MPFFIQKNNYLKSLPQVLAYHARELMNSLKDLDLDLYTDVMVMIGINDVKRLGINEWQVKKVSEKLVICSLICLHGLDFKITSSTATVYTLKLVNFVININSFANDSYCYYFR